MTMKNKLVAMLVGVFTLVGAAGLLGLERAVHATSVDDYPNKPITLIVPIAPGGMTDALGRLLSQKITEHWQQPVVVENRAGASGIIGTDVVARAKPDGYTMLITITSHVQNPSLYNTLPFDAVKDFTPVGQLAQSQVSLVVTQDFPADDLAGFVRVVKATPGTYNFSSFGNATTGHIYGQKFSSDNGLDMAHIPYKGAGPQLTALLGGHVKAGWIDVGTVRPYIESGKLKLLGVIGTTRAPLFPNVPTLAEAGFPGFEAAGWLGTFMPANTPAPIVEKMGAEVSRIIALPDVQERFKSLGLAPTVSSPEAFAEVVQRDTQTWTGIITKENIRAD